MAEPETPQSEESPILELKPGIYTSSFWITLITSSLAIMVATGVIGAETQDRVAAIVEDVVMAVFSVIAVVHFMIGRRKLKREVMEMNTQIIQTAIKEEGK